MSLQVSALARSLERVQVVLKGVEGCDVAHAGGGDDQPRADETE